MRRKSENELLAKLWFGSKVGKQFIVDNLEVSAKYAENNLKYFKNVAKPLMEARAKKQGSNLEVVCRLMIIDYAIREYENSLKWARNALKKIKDIKPRHSKTRTLKPDE